MYTRSHSYALHYWLFAFFLLVSASSRLHAQVDTGSIGGVVTDVTGAAIPGAAVVLREEKTGLTLTTSSGADGVFNLSPVKLGTYTLTTSHDGFNRA